MRESEYREVSSPRAVIWMWVCLSILYDLFFKCLPASDYTTSSVCVCVCMLNMISPKKRETHSLRKYFSIRVFVCVVSVGLFNIWNYIMFCCGALTSVRCERVFSRPVSPAYRSFLRSLHPFIIIIILPSLSSSAISLHWCFFLSMVVVVVVFYVWLCVWETRGNNTYFFLFLLTALRGGVIGRVPCMLPYWNLRFSAGFKIWNEHISESSTDIIAPER